MWLCQVAFFALCMGLAGLIFFYIGVSMGWLYVCFLSFLDWCHLSRKDIDFHGCDIRLGCCADCAVCDVVESKQVGLRGGFYRGICCGYHRLARHNQCAEWWSYQCDGM
jgi:hypothetical protein